MNMDFEKQTKKGVRDVMKVINPDLRISPRAVQMICDCLRGITDHLVEECMTTGQRKKQTQMSLAKAQKAITKVFSGGLRAHAEAAANQAIFKYNAGLLIYIPKRRKTEQEKLRKPKHLEEFAKGIPAITELVRPNLLVNKDAKQLLALILQQMTQTFVKKSHETSEGQGTLGVEDIVKAVQDSMSSTIARHAIAEGNRNVLLLMSSQNRHKMEDLVKKKK